MTGGSARDRDPEFIRAKQIVFRLLKYRLRSQHEIQAKLLAKNISGTVCTEIIRYFVATGLLNDMLFTRAWIASRLKKPLGLRRIHQELKAKGIDEDIIADETQRALGEYDEIVTIRNLARRRLRQYRGLNRLKVRQRLYAYLIRRGFSSDLIFKVLREMNSHDRE